MPGHRLSLGHRLEAPDRDALFAAAREHIERDHPEMERSDDQIRARIRGRRLRGPERVVSGAGRLEGRPGARSGAPPAGRDRRRDDVARPRRAGRRLGPRPGERWLDLATGTAPSRCGPRGPGPSNRTRPRAGADRDGGATRHSAAPHGALRRRRRRAAALRGRLLRRRVLRPRRRVRRRSRRGGGRARPHLPSGRATRPHLLAAQPRAPAPDGAGGLHATGRRRAPAPTGRGATTPQDLLGEHFELDFAEAVCPWTGESGEALWQLFLRADGVAKAGVAALSDGEREALGGDWVEYFERHRSEAGVCAPRPYLIIQGRRVD